MERVIKANLAYGKGDFYEAEEHLLEHLYDCPHDKMAWQMLGNVRVKLGKLKLSECAFEMVKALECSL
jgi:hypothetical protein